MVSTRQAPYAAVKQALKDGLAAGLWPAGALMPSEAELRHQVGLGRHQLTRRPVPGGQPVLEELLDPRIRRQRG